MRPYGLLAIIVLSLAIIWFVFLLPAAVSNCNDGFEEYVQSIPITGSMEQVHVSYDGIWRFTPLKSEIENLTMQGARFTEEDLIVFEPELAIKSVEFKPMTMMKTGKPEVIKIGHVDFKAKMPWQVLMVLLRERNPNFKVSEMGITAPHTIQITGLLMDVQSEVIITGNIQVNIDGEIELIPLEVTNFLNEAVRDANAKSKVLDAVDLKWKFRIMDMDLLVNRAAISSQGVYIEAESDGWEPSDEIPPEEENQSS